MSRVRPEVSAFGPAHFAPPCAAHGDTARHEALAGVAPGQGRILCVVVLGVVLLGTRLAWPGVTEQIAITFQEVAQALRDALSPVEGMVVAVDGERVSLDLKEREKIFPGMELRIVRRGEPFRHPLTGVVLGRHEELLGHAQVLEVREPFSTARLIPRPEAPPARVEDLVRVTRGRIRVAVAPILDLTRSRLDAKRAPYLLAAALERTGRFAPTDPQAVSDLLAEARVRTVDLFTMPALAIQLSQKLEVEGWVIPLLVEVRGIPVVDATWVSAITGSPLFSRRHSLIPASPEAQRRFPWEPPPTQ